MSCVLTEHPCYSPAAHRFFGRIHLPVAPLCNLQCRYCLRKYDCPNESRPGVTSRVLTPLQALAAAREAAGRTELSLRVAGIAGPGEPLCNPETFETLALLREGLPQLMLCVSTNGLLLPDCVARLSALSVAAVTVTVNTLREETAARVYRDGPRELLLRQREGARAAASLGMALKINTVLIPGVNDDEIEEIAAFARDAGAAIMNVMPLIPQGELAAFDPPDAVLLARCRAAAGAYLPQSYHCRQCRADACGIPALERTIPEIQSACPAV